MTTTNVFKFLSVRAPDSTALAARADQMLRDPRVFDATGIGKIVAIADPPKSEIATIADIRAFASRSRLSPTARDPFVEKVAAIVNANSAVFDADRFDAGMRGVIGSEPDAFLSSKQLVGLWTQSWDKLYVAYILKRVDPIDLGPAMRDLRLLGVVEGWAQGKIASADTLADYLARAVVVPARLASFARPEPRKSAAYSSPPDAAVLAQYDAQWSTIAGLHTAQHELRSVRWQQKFTTTIMEDAKDPSDGTKSEKVSVLESRRLEMNAKDVARLSPSTRQWLTSVNGYAELTPASLFERLASDLSAAHSVASVQRDPHFFARMPKSEPWTSVYAAYVDMRLYPLNLTLPDETDAFTATLPGFKPLGIGDLKVVKQTFERYTAGEIAHIENVLQGEYKERRHRQLARSEDIITVEQEEIKESERDSQTTDRFELKRESENVIRTDMEVSAGLTVSASYGPVTIGVRGDFAYTSSSSETNRSASNFAKEIVERSVDKIQKKAREERIRKLLNETEETNLHGIDNKAGSTNISGIYRWVDKHYTAQIFNYGRRLMFEFIVPEPAAYLAHVRGATATAADPMEPDLVPLGEMTHRDLSESNYHLLLQRYSVTGVLPPPPMYTTIGVALSYSQMEATETQADTKPELMVPAGYVAVNWTGARCSHSTREPTGEALFVGNGNAGGLLDSEDTNVPVALLMVNKAGFVATIEVHCRRTDRHFEEWQIKTFEKIVGAYRALVAERKARPSSAKSSLVNVVGRNPAINRRTENTELKKHCISIFSNQFFGGFDAMRGAPPQINIPESLEEGAYIQFFEQAFEWEQMTYLLYPYFWGRKQNWPAHLNGTPDADPLFDQFLNAGAARVLIPVHPMYDDAVLYYMKSGRIWNGGEAPRIDDPMFLSIAEELREQQDDLEQAVPEGDPWNVVVPTSLVYVQGDFALQTTNDELNPSSR